MINIITELSQRKAVTSLRILYPIWAIIGIFSIQYVPSKLIVIGDAAATANNIMANELEQAAEVHRYVETGHKKGSVVITVEHNNKA